jgi:squalene cyclase
MVDYSHVEVTASVLCGLVAARPRISGHRDAELRRALRDGERYLRRHQRPDGSWEGNWGICFTYGTWFAVRGLRAVGAAPGDPAIGRAVRFLRSKQLPDGGWGESWQSCPRREYVHHPDGAQPVMTAWALLALLEAGAGADDDAVARGIGRLLDDQLADGDWPQRSVTGVFNRTCMLHYRLYRNVFPIWALALANRADHTSWFVESRNRVAR